MADGEFKTDLDDLEASEGVPTHTVAAVSVFSGFGQSAHWWASKEKAGEATRHASPLLTRNVPSHLPAAILRLLRPIAAAHETVAMVLTRLFPSRRQLPRCVSLTPLLLCSGALLNLPRRSRSHYLHLDLPEQ